MAPLEVGKWLGLDLGDLKCQGRNVDFKVEGLIRSLNQVASRCLVGEVSATEGALARGFPESLRWLRPPSGASTADGVQASFARRTGPWAQVHSPCTPPGSKLAQGALLTSL